jgi:lantibiotic modifying enzyme
MLLQPYFHSDSHPAFRNPQIRTVRKQQLNNDSAEYCAQQERENEKIVLDYIPVLTKLYNHNKVPFQYLSKAFDNVCYNVMIPICRHYSDRLFQYLKEQNTIIGKVSFLNYATESLLNMLYNWSYKTLWKEYQEFVLTLPDENNEMTENEVNQLFISEFQNQEKIQVFFSKYPILAKLLCDSSEIWLNKYRLIYEFLSQDIFSVMNYFGFSIDIDKPVEIQNLTISGDNHDKNNFVAIIEFAGNQKIVLKNRIAKPEMVLSKSIDFLADKNINLKSPKILETGGHY